MMNDLDWAAIQVSLDGGDLAVLPTETVYGLAVVARHSMFVDRLYAAKGRDFNKPLAIVVHDLAMAENFGAFNDTARALAKKHWPGPLTIVLDATKIVLEAKARKLLDARTLGEMDGQPTIALRCPDAEWRTKLTGPIALTSVNLSGQPDMTNLDELEKFPDEFLKHINFSLDGDVPMSGKATTIVRVSGDKVTILRQGELDISL